MSSDKRNLFIQSPPQYPGLNLATVTMHQPTADPSKTAYNSVEMWQVCPAGREPVSNWRDLEQNRNTETWKNHVEEGKLKVENNEKFIRAKINAPAEQKCTSRIPIFSLLLFLLFSSPWPFSSLITSSNRSVIFLLPRCQHPYLCSQRRVLLSHYLIIGALVDHLCSLWHSERAVTFMEAQLC